MNIGDLFLSLGVQDTAAFKTTIEKAAGDAGTAGSKKLSSTMAAGLKVGSLLVGGAFALMTKGALQMEEAQGKFQAATGRSREEAIAFSKDMNGLVGTAKTVGTSFDEITATGIAVSQQFDITGQKATDLTDDILGFAKVTGQDASDAAGALDGVLTSFGLSADDAAGFMDKLVFSTQKYGTDSGPATLATLQKMAPALTTMGMSLDDGVELLNAFEVAEVDADTAQRGLQKAIAGLKPGENLDDLITQISAIEDPTLRAQKAIEIFGTKAGVGLAKIIQPGMTSLDEFGVTADEAAGTVDTAAENLLTTSDKFKIFAEKIGGFLREGGQAFGPLLTGLASVGTLAAPMAKLGINMAKGLTGVFTGLLRNVGILGAATALGAAEGEAQAVGATGPGVLRSFLTKFGLLTPAKVGAAITAGTLEGEAEGGAAATAAATKMAASGGAMSAAGLGLGSLFGIGIVAAASIPVLDWLDHQFGQSPAQAEANANAAVQPMADALAAWAIKMKAEGRDVYGNLGTSLAGSVRSGFVDGWVSPFGVIRDDLSGSGPGVGTAGSQLGETSAGSVRKGFVDGWVSPFGVIPGALHEAEPAVGAAGEQVGTTGATGVVTGFQARWPAGTAFSVIASDLKAEMEETARIASESARGIDHNLADALRDSSDVVKQAMDDVMWAIEHPMELEAKIAEIEGALTTLAYKRGLASNTDEINTVIDQQMANLEQQWSKLTGKAWDAGAAAASAWDAAYKKNLVSNSNYRGDFFGVHLGDPPKKRHRAMGGQVTAGMPYIVGEFRPELFVPDRNGTIISSLSKFQPETKHETNRSMSVGDVTIIVNGVDGDPAEIGKGAADAFIWNLEHAMSAVTSG